MRDSILLLAVVLVASRPWQSLGYYYYFFFTLMLWFLNVFLIGSYIFIEASQRSPGEKARLLSGWIEPHETVCFQFWYHMHGADIGNLIVYLKTNQSETLVWRLSGDKGNLWRFGQKTLNSPSFYKVSL